MVGLGGAERRVIPQTWLNLPLRPLNLSEHSQGYSFSWMSWPPIILLSREIVSICIWSEIPSNNHYLWELMSYFYLTSETGSKCSSFLYLVVEPLSPQWGKSSSLFVTGICTESAAAVVVRIGGLRLLLFLFRRGGFLFRRGGTYREIKISHVRLQKWSSHELKSYQRSWTRSRNRARTTDGRLFFGRKSDEDWANNDGSDGGGGGGGFAMIALKSAPR